RILGVSRSAMKTFLLPDSALPATKRASSAMNRDTSFSLGQLDAMPFENHLDAAMTRRSQSVRSSMDLAAAAETGTKRRGNSPALLMKSPRWKARLGSGFTDRLPSSFTMARASPIVGEPSGSKV